MDKKKSQKNWKYTDEHLENLYGRPQSEKNAVTQGLARIPKYFKQRRVCFEEIYNNLKNNGFGRYPEIEDVGTFDIIYIRITQLMEDIDYYRDLPEWNCSSDKSKIMQILIEAIINKENFDNSSLTTANYYREVDGLKNQFRKVQLEYFTLMEKINTKLNQFYPDPFKTPLDIPPHPSDNYRVALDKLLRIELNEDTSKNLLEIALDIKKIKSTKAMKKLDYKLVGDLTKSVDKNYHHLPKDAKALLKKAVKKTIKPTSKP